MKREVTMYVSFNFGGMAYLTVTLYEGKTLNECLKMRSDAIDGYYDAHLKIFVKI